MHKKKSKPDVILIGDSIIEYWGMVNTTFFADNNCERKGIGGQTTDEILSRFDDDVIKNNPKVVIIEGGINDIAENRESYDANKTFNNIKSMAEKAQEEDIKVILTSLLPTDSIHWNTNLPDVSKKVSDLNTKLKAYANEKGFIYADIYPILADTSNGKRMIPAYTNDGVHLTEAGYKAIEPVIKIAIDKAMSVKD